MPDAAYDAHAGRYERFVDPTLAGAAERLAELAGARAGVAVLDLATGTGAAARAAAARGARMVAVDSSRGMLAVARRLAPELDLRVADAHALPFEPDTFEAITCGLSLSHFRRRDEVLGEVLRLLRAGGRFVASAWAPGGVFPTAAIDDILPDAADAVADAALDEDTWSSPESGADVLRRAGFASVTATTEVFTGRFRDAEQALAWELAWPLTAARLAPLDPAAREDLIAAARETLAGADLAWRFVFNFFVARC